MILWKSIIPGRRSERFTTRKWGAVAWRKAKRLNPRVVAICSQGFVALLMALSAIGQPMPSVVVRAPVTNLFAVSAVRRDGVESAPSNVVASTNASVTLEWGYGDTSGLLGFRLYHGRTASTMAGQFIGNTLTAHWPHITLLTHREFTVTANVGLQTTDPKAPALFYTICATSNFHDWFPVGTTGQIRIKVRSY